MLKTTEKSCGNIMTKAEQLQIDIKDLRNWKRTCSK